MNPIRWLIFERHLSKFVRRMPFYVIRHFGIKDTYEPKEIDFIIERYGFRDTYTPIAYAMFCRCDEFEQLSSRFKPHSTRSAIRKRINEKYFWDKKDFNLKDLMLKSVFKVDWGDDAPFLNYEYCEMMEKLGENPARYIQALDDSVVQEKQISSSLPTSSYETKQESTDHSLKNKKWGIFIFVVTCIVISLWLIYKFDPELVYIPWFIPWYVAWGAIGLGIAVVVFAVVIGFLPPDPEDETSIVFFIPLVLWLVVPASIFILLSNYFGWTPP